MMIHRRWRFSLLEILICLTILAMMTSLLGVKVFGLIKEHRFKHTVSLVQQHLMHMKISAISHRCDIEVVLEKTKEGYQIKAYSDRPSFRPFIHNLSCVDEIKIQEHLVKKMSIFCYSSGKLSSQDIIIFKTAGNPLLFRLNLQTLEMDCFYS